MRVAGRRHWRATGIAGILASIVAIGGLLLGHGPALVRAARTDVKIAMPAPASLDPARQSDIDSAAVAAQLFESLTTFDTGLVLRPALARSWDVAGNGQQVTFHLRPGLTFSDGTPLTGADVVRSWLRIIDSQHPSPLATLMLDVKGARDYLTGANSDETRVGIHAQGQDVTVDLERPGADFPSVVASPTFAIVPAAGDCASAVVLGQCGVSSGGYTLSTSTETELTLAANARYWAGAPAIQTVHVVIDLGGRSPVDVFSAGDIDTTAVASNDGSWIRFDRDLGPSLRTTSSLSLTYLGFDTSKPPFDNADVRRAIGQAVDWHRIVELGTFGGDIPATSMVPPGIQGRSDTSWLPPHDPAGARALLAKAGYPDGKGFPDVALGGGVLSSAIAAELKRELGITIRIENYDDYFTRLSTDPPGMWALGWVADYPGQNDFLGVLLETGASGNYGHWSSPDFDAAIAQALASREPARASAAFDSALAIVQSDVPAIPLAYPAPSWSLTRDGLLGAGVSGLGIPRFAGLAWAP
jgi:oligopeptide transport system substrate-binding protein